MNRNRKHRMQKNTLDVILQYPYYKYIPIDEIKNKQIENEKKHIHTDITRIISKDEYSNCNTTHNVVNEQYSTETPKKSIIVDNDIPVYNVIPTHEYNTYVVDTKSINDRIIGLNKQILENSDKINNQVYFININDQKIYQQHMIISKNNIDITYQQQQLYQLQTELENCKKQINFHSSMIELFNNYIQNPTSHTEQQIETPHYSVNYNEYGTAEYGTADYGTTECLQEFVATA